MVSYPLPTLTDIKYPHHGSETQLILEVQLDNQAIPKTQIPYQLNYGSELTSRYEYQNES